MISPSWAQTETGSLLIEIPLTDLVTADQINGLSKFYPQDHHMSWSLYVPKKYDPDTPPGMLICISPTPSGKPPASWIPVLERENIIYISANDAGNFVAARQRISNVVFGLAYVQSNYAIDRKRTFLSGFSGGARMTNTIIEILPNLFTGAMFVGGAYDWEGDKASVKAALKGRSYVFVTSKRDHARYETRRTYRKYRDLGVANVKMIDTPFLFHELPDAKEFEEALKFLSKPSTR